MQNSTQVIAITEQILNLRRIVEQNETRSIHRFIDNSETAMHTTRIKAATEHFNKIIQSNFSKAFWERLSLGQQHLRYGPIGEKICVTKILNEIRAFILDEIINSPRLETATTLKWLQENENRKILSDSTHPRHAELLIESRRYLNSLSNPCHIAWRNFDAGTITIDWDNLFEGPHARHDCRLRLAYYYLVVRDSEQTPEAALNGKGNFIRILADIRRAHNYVARLTHRSTDSPSCPDGTLGRLAEIGKYHPTAALPLDPSEQLPRIFNSVFLHPTLREAFRSDGNYVEKTSLYKALLDLHINAEAIATHRVSYSNDLLEKRNQFVKNLGDVRNVIDAIQKELVALRCSRTVLDAQESQVASLMLLDPSWRSGAEIIRDVFISSMSDEERIRWNAESLENVPLRNSPTPTPTAGPTQQATVNPFPDTTYEQELTNTRARIGKTTQEQLQRLALRSYNSNRINRILYPILTKEGIDNMMAETAARAVSREMTIPGQLSPTSKILEEQLQAELSSLPSKQVQELTRVLSITLSNFVLMIRPDTFGSAQTIERTRAVVAAAERQRQATEAAAARAAAEERRRQEATARAAEIERQRRETAARIAESDRLITAMFEENRRRIQAEADRRRQEAAATLARIQAEADRRKQEADARAALVAAEAARVAAEAARIEAARLAAIQEAQAREAQRLQLQQQLDTARTQKNGAECIRIAAERRRSGLN